MLMIVRRAAGVVFGLLAVASTRIHAQERNPTLVGIVRADGFVIPFARFDGRRWLEFPGPADRYRVPDQYELPAKWAVHYTRSSARQIVAGGESVSFIDNSGIDFDSWGQITNLPDRDVGADGNAPPRVGIALSGQGLQTHAVTFAEGNARSPTWQLNRREIERAFHRGADTLPRDVLPLRLRHLYMARQNVDGAQLFYVDAIASPTREESQACPRAVYYQAWFRRPSATQSIVVVEDSIHSGHDCDSPGAQPSTNIPRGVFALDGRWFIAIEYQYYEGGDRQLLELTRTSLTPAHPLRQ